MELNTFNKQNKMTNYSINTSSRISFKGIYNSNIVTPESIPKIVDYFEKSTAKYLQRDKLNVKRLQKILKKLIPNLPIEIKDVSESAAFSNADLQGLSESVLKDGKFQTTFYLDLKNLFRLDKIGKANAHDTMVHEFSHSLQDNTAEESSLILKLLNSNKLEKISNVFCDFEREILEKTIFKLSDKDFVKSVEKIDYQELFKFIKSDPETIKKLYKETFEKVLEKNNITTPEEKKEIINYFIIRARDEKQSYKLGFNAQKQFLGQGKKHFNYELKAVLYDDIMKFFKKELDAA